MYYLDLDTKNTPHTIDARLYHEVLPFTGVRYTYVAYKTYDFEMLKDQVYMVLLISVIRKKIHGI